MRCRSLIAGIIALASALVAHSCELQMVGGLAEGMVGVAATLASSSLGNLPGTALGVAVWEHGADQMSTGAYRMWYGQDVDTQTSQALQSVGMPRDWANGIDAGLSAAGSMGANAVIRTAGVISAARVEAVGGKTIAVSTYFPASDGVVGEKGTTYLYKGVRIDRYGGGSNSRYFSPVGTPAEIRALPQSSLGGELRTFIVEKPFPVEQGVVAPAFDQIGLGVQYKAPVSLGVLLDRGILREIR